MDKDESEYVRRVTLQSIVIEELIKCMNNRTHLDAFLIAEVIDDFYKKYESHQLQDLMWKAKRDFEDMIIDKIFVGFSEKKTV